MIIAVLPNGEYHVVDNSQPVKFYKLTSQQLNVFANTDATIPECGKLVGQYPEVK